ncbi:MAG: hypothetical protein M1819_001722 [Sarea resinae]|nr:MAG: hypothetical protein M1819_001722 [Sarea resinae]
MKFNSQYDEFYRYTSGRWIWDEEQQLHDRFRRFNVPELQRVAARSIGARMCTGITKLAEGSFNKVFRLTMDDGKIVIARIPNPNAGPRYYTTASEVATMDFVRTILKIPAPEVYAWSASTDDPVGAEYIIMEEAAGRQAVDTWDTLELESKVAIMKELISIEKKLLSVCLTSYGNIYYKSDAIEGSVAAEVIGDASPQIKREVSERFTVGPSVERDFWSKERSEMEIDRGPWNHPLAYISAIAHRDIAWIKRYAVPRAADDPLATSSAQNSPNEHISILEKYLAVAPYLLPADPELANSNLWHKDLHSRNIFIENDCITSIIDWQSVWAGPLFLQARHPKLVDHRGEVILKLPTNFKDLKDGKKAELRRQVASSIILHLYKLYTAKINPRLNKVYRVEHGRTRGEAISFAGDTWDDDILPFRESLVRIEKYWDELGTNVPCPIHFPEEELRSHSNDAEGWNEVQDFWESIAGLVTRDGWTPSDRYSDAVALFAELRENGLKAMKGKERESFEKETHWASKPIE